MNFAARPLACLIIAPCTAALPVPAQTAAQCGTLAGRATLTSMQLTYAYILAKARKKRAISTLPGK